MHEKGFFSKVRDLFYRVAFARCYAVADDKATGVGTITTEASTMVQLGRADSARNLIAGLTLALTGGDQRIHVYHGETAPGSGYANAPIGSFFIQATQSGGAITAINIWLKTTSTVWERFTVGAGQGAGTAGTGVTAVEYGTARSHVTVLTVSSTLGAIAGGANLALGKLVYTLPAGAQIVKAAYMSMALDEVDGNITADTPDVGLGSVIASGAVALLGGTATFEDMITGQTAADCNGTATVKTIAGQIFVTEAAGAKTVHFNVADGWAAGGETACPIAGTIVIEWVAMA
jgi:hypothetical protein